MATVNVTTTKLTELNKAENIRYSSVTSSDNVFLDYNGAGDEKLLVLVTGTATVKLYKGNGIQGVVDIQQSISTAGAIRLDSGLFKNMTGTNKGKVKLTTSANASVALIQLP